MSSEIRGQESISPHCHEFRATCAYLSAPITLDERGLPASRTNGRPCHAKGVQYDCVSNRQLVWVQNNFIRILDEGIQRNAPTFVLENLAAVIAGGLGRVPTAVMPCGAAVDHKSPPSFSLSLRRRFFRFTYGESQLLSWAHRYDAQADEALARGFTLICEGKFWAFCNVRFTHLSDLMRGFPVSCQI